MPKGEESQGTTRSGPYVASGRRFYYASSYHLPGIVGGGAEVARLAIPWLEDFYGAKCTSKWPFDFAHGEPWYAKQAAETDVQSVKDADFVLFLPLTKTSRGTHVEMGMAIALGKPVYGQRFAEGDDGTAFDALGEGLPPRAEAIVLEALAEVRRNHAGSGPQAPAPMPRIGGAR